jgi:hypothetical protein
MHLRNDHARQIVDTEQVFNEWMSADGEYAHRYAGSMVWKTISEKDYLYRKTKETGIWTSLGARSEESEVTYQQFHSGRQALKERLQSLSVRLNELAAINRAMGLGRMPLLSARIARVLHRSRLMGTALDIVGTNALFVYERLAGARIDSGLLATGDIDLLFDSRARLNLISTDFNPDGLIGLLQKLDRSFQRNARNSFTAANKDGFLVDLIQPFPKDPMTTAKRLRIGDNPDDLTAVEIEGLQWLVNSPKVTAIVLDERGFPCLCSAPDPRSFAMHKLWVSRRQDRDPLKRSRDHDQATLMFELIARFMPQLTFDDPALGAVPLEMRKEAVTYVQSKAREWHEATQPDW